MSRAGAWLHRMAARVCSEETVARLIEPIVADLRHEHTRALEHGRRWAAWRIRACGYLTFWKAVLMYSAVATPRVILLAAAADGWLLARITGIAAGVFLAVTVLLILPPLDAGARASSASRGLLWLSLLPQAMALAIPIALSSAIAYGCRGRRPSRRLVATVLTFALCGTGLALATRQWLIPAGNQAFRVAMAGGGIDVQGLRGPNEMSLTEIGARIDAARATGSPAGQPSAEAARLTRIYHLHWALCWASLALGLFSLGISTFSGRRLAALAAGVGAPVAYWASLWVLDAAIDRQAALHAMSPWLPNVLFIASGWVLLRLRSRHSDLTPPIQPSAA